MFAAKPCLLAVALAVHPGFAAAAAFDDGQEAYAAGRFEEARLIWTPLAVTGDAGALFGLGLLHDLGQGVPADPAAAYGWYRRAAEAGLDRAQFNVAVMLDSGIGVARDPAQAATWYAKAGAQGHGRAQYNLAQLYAAGEGVPRNPVQARAWYASAARGGLAAAADKLAALTRAEARRAPSKQPAAEAAATAGGLAPAVLMAPIADAVIGIGSVPVPIELVWLAPAQPVPASFFVQVFAREGEGRQEAFAGFVDESAVLVQLMPAHYEWHVYLVTREAAGGGVTTVSTVSEWARFTVQ